MNELIAQNEFLWHSGTGIVLLGAMWMMLRWFATREIKRLDDLFKEFKEFAKTFTDYQIACERRFSRLEGAYLEREQVTPPHGYRRRDEDK